MQALTSHPADSRALVHRLSLRLLFTRGVVVFALVAWAFALRFLMRCPRRTALILAACLQKTAPHLCSNSNCTYGANGKHFVLFFLTERLHLSGGHLIASCLGGIQPVECALIIPVATSNEAGSIRPESGGIP